MTRLLVGTSAGLVGAAGPDPADGRPIRVFGDAAIAGSSVLLWWDGSSWREMAVAPGLLCAVDAPGGLLTGTEGAHLLQLRDGGLHRIEAFEEVADRSRWHTPWGGPPDTRSLAVTDDDVLLANVHVGGIPRSTDGGRTWEPTIDVDDDVHQVLAVPGRPAFVLAAAAVGLCRSRDGGRTWSVDAEGLHASYCRAVATGGDAVFVSASEGPRGARSAIYRGRLDDAAPLERRTEWIDGNVDTGCLAADEETVAYGTAAGEVLVSHDEGKTWSTAYTDVGSVLTVTLA